MRIAILGTRGIPNNYGGFEQFAEYLSLGLTKKGHDVSVYNSHSHPYKDTVWNNINIIHVYDPENRIGTIGQFIYDAGCINDSRKRKFDVILQLGYTSNSVWSRLLPKRSIIVTNMDGMEWKRSKYSKIVQAFLHKAEKWAVTSSDYLIADSIGIKNNLKISYNIESEYIAYGATLFNEPDFSKIKDKNPELNPFEYDMLIARMEPENNIETILISKIASQNDIPLLIIGSTENSFGQYLIKNYSGDSRIMFLGSIYDIDYLNNIRNFSNLYLHGHSVGGTNPSLLEAMASGALICAHNNTFNKSILQDDAFYFSNAHELTQLLDIVKKEDYSHFIIKNSKKISEYYNWPIIIEKYERFLTFAFQNGKK